MKKYLLLLLLVLFAGCATSSLPFAGNHKHKTIKRMSHRQVKKAHEKNWCVYPNAKR